MKDAYFHLDMHPVPPQVPQFSNRTLTLPVSGPFGTATASRVFIKVFSMVGAHMYRLGHSVFPYVNNWLLLVLSQQEAISIIHCLCSLLASLGSCVNEEKLVLIHTQTIRFLGAWLSSIMVRAFLPTAGFTVLTALIKSMVTTICCSLHLLGHVSLHLCDMA